MARFDLLEIASYIARDNPNRAYSFVDELESACGTLAGQPDKGAPRFGLRQGLRVLLYGRYLIAYVNVDGAVRVERVLHSARDIATLLSEV